MSARSIGRCPADLDPGEDDLLSLLDAGGQTGVIDVDHRRRDSRTGVGEAAIPAPIRPAPTTPTRSTFAGSTSALSTPGVVGEPVPS